MNKYVFASVIAVALLLIAMYSISLRNAGTKDRALESTNDDPLEVQRDVFMGEKLTKSDAEWRELLTAQQYQITRQKGTEPAGSGEYAYSKDVGVYKCVCCELDLFHSEHKYESGTGWPSFVAPIDERHVDEQEDRGWWSVRTEVLCARCDAHLGHVFPDGPRESTGLRYCMNSAALKFQPAEEADSP